MKALKPGETSVWRNQFLQQKEVESHTQSIILQRLDAHETQLSSSREISFKDEREREKQSRECARLSDDNALLRKQQSALIAAVDRFVNVRAKDLTSVETALQVAGVELTVETLRSDPGLESAFALAPGQEPSQAMYAERLRQQQKRDEHRIRRICDAVRWLHDNFKDHQRLLREAEAAHQGEAQRRKESEIQLEGLH